MNVALYARVSSDRQDVDLSISAQLRALRDFASQNGHQLVREFVDEAESGRTAARPAFKEMVSLVRLKNPPFEAILVWKLNRFARNREDSIIYKSLLRKRGVQVISINEPVEDTPAGHMLEGIIEVMDEFFSVNLAQDVIRGMKENAMRGHFTGGKPPYGFRIEKVKDEHKLRSTLVPETTLAPVAKRAFNMAISGKGIKEIAKGFNNDGIITATGKKWTSTGIHSLLTNEVYTGTLVWGKRSNIQPIRIENAWPAIVDRETFLKVQAILKSRAPKIIHPRRAVSDYLLSGIIKCGVCGKAMSGHSAKSGKFFYYRCSNATKRGPSECPGHWIPKSKIEGFIVDRIRSYILTEENLLELASIVNEEIDASMNSVMERQETLELQISDVDSRLEHLYDALEKGSFSSDELAPRIRKLQERKNGLLEKKREIAVEAQPNFLEMPELKVIQGYVENLSSLLASSSIVEKRGFLKSFVNEIIVVDGMITINYRLPMPPENSEEENVAVLPFIQHGRPYRSRTCDTLIKSQVDIFTDFGLLSKLESARKVFSF